MLNPLALIGLVISWAFLGRLWAVEAGRMGGCAAAHDRSPNGCAYAALNG
jgi:hypothetical protein